MKKYPLSGEATKTSDLDDCASAMKTSTFVPIDPPRPREIRDSEVSEKSGGKRAKRAVDSIPKAHTSLPDGALVSGVQDCGRERAGEVYTAVAQDAKMEILDQFVPACHKSGRRPPRHARRRSLSC